MTDYYKADYFHKEYATLEECIENTRKLLETKGESVFSYRDGINIYKFRVPVLVYQFEKEVTVKLTEKEVINE